MNLELTVETLLLDESFIDYCRNENSVYQHKWTTIAAAEPSNKAVMEEARNWLLTLHPSLSREEILVEIEKVKAAIQPGEITKPPVKDLQKPAAIRKLPVKYTWRLAAALLLLISLPLTYYLLRESPPKEPEFSMAFVQTGMGERKQVTLPDGTVVILKSNTRLLLDQAYNESDRHIQLEGQAYFAVFPNKSKPLTVHSGDFATTALGTAFFIDGNNPDAEYAVQLLEGKILVQSADEKQQLQEPGFEINWKKQNPSFARQNFDPQELTNWINGNLAFEYHTAADVFRQLEAWYGVAITDKRSQKGAIKITGNYSDLPLQDILQAVCFTLNCQYRLEENSIIIE